METDTWILIVPGLISLSAFLVLAIQGLGWLGETERRPLEGSLQKRLNFSGSVAQSSESSGALLNLFPQGIQLEVMFNWNGHLWEAHEVLGVAVGCGLEEVEQAYARECENVDPHSRAFLKMALCAIQEVRRDRSLSGDRV